MLPLASTHRYPAGIGAGTGDLGCRSGWAWLGLRKPPAVSVGQRRGDRSGGQLKSLPLESQNEWPRLWLLASKLWLLPQVDKETNTETPAPSPTVVRPKDRRVGTPSPGPFLRGSTIIRSKTFSPGPQSQYVCRVSKQVVLSFSQHVSRGVAESRPPHTLPGANPNDARVARHLQHLNAAEP